MVLLVLWACGGPNLPDDWKGADPLEITQSECAGDPLGDTDEHLELELSPGTVDFHYVDAHFRCAQDVEAFVRWPQDDVAEILVQPVDMTPRDVARCDCLYDVRGALDDVAPGALEVGLYRRWDEQNDDTDPVEIDRVQVHLDP